MKVCGSARSLLSLCARPYAVARTGAHHLGAHPCKLAEQSGVLSLEHKQGSRRERRAIIRVASSLEAGARQLADNVENAVHIPNPCKDDRASKWDRNEHNLRTLLNKTYCTLRKRLWVAVLALFYLYNEAVAKLPWVRIRRFEAWFWEKVRLKWLPAASAATVLARQYASDVAQDLRGAPGKVLRDAWAAPGRLWQRKDALETEVEEDMEHAKQDLDASMQKQGEAVRSAVPDAVNPLLLGRNLRERLDAGALNRDGFDAAMAELQQSVRKSVPFLRPDDSEAVSSQLESQSEDLAPAPEPALVTGFLNLPVTGSLGGERASEGKEALSEAAEDVKRHGGADARGISLGWLRALRARAPFGWFGKPRAEREQAAADKAEEAAAGSRGLSLGFLGKGLFGTSKANAELEGTDSPEKAAGNGLSLDFLKVGPFKSNGAAASDAAAQEEQESEERPEKKAFSLGFLKFGR